MQFPMGEMGLSLKLLSELFDRLPLGVVVLDRDARIVVYNAAEERLANRRRERVIGRDFFRDIAPCMDVRELGGRFFDGIGRVELDARTEFSFPFPFLDEPRDVVVSMTSIEVESEPYGCLFIEDVSLQRSVDRMKQTLTDLLIHDLKNPLSAVLFNLDVLRTHSAFNDHQDVQEMVEECRDAAGRLQQMLVNLLDVTRLETNVFPVARAETGIAELMAILATQSLPLTRGRRVTLKLLDCDPDLVCRLDPSLIKRAVGNLIENGLRYARSTVTLSARSAEKSIEIEVRDDGPGIPAALHCTLFDRAPVARTGLKGQSEYNRGLGLSFVQLATRAHGGEVSVACPSSGGTIFRMTIPEDRPIDD